MDLPEAEEHLAAFRQRYPDREVIAVSAKEQQGIEELKRALERWLAAEEQPEPALSSSVFYAEAVGPRADE
jgi:selenocysteine-specific translation elongation factor